MTEVSFRGKVKHFSGTTPSPRKISNLFYDSRTESSLRSSKSLGYNKISDYLGEGKSHRKESLRSRPNSFIENKYNIDYDDSDEKEKKFEIIEKSE